MKKIFNDSKEAQWYNNKLRWTYLLYRVSCGKGSSLDINCLGKDDEFGHISFSIRKVQKGSRKNVMESKYRCDLAHSTGVCWICGETQPRVIERHHLFESRSNNKHGNTYRTDFVCGICANCHRKRKVTGGETERHQIAILNAIEKEWFGLGGDLG